MKPKVNLRLCIGCGGCESMCPDCFKVEDDGKAHVLGGCKSDSCNLQDAIEACPVSAITFE